MQNWTGCSQLGMEETVTLVDSRDNNSYTVAKLKDGKCWMTQNLRIFNYSATEEDSNISGTYNIPASSKIWSNGPGNADVFIDETYGGHYSRAVATAGDTVYNNSSHKAPYSICPKNWRLPTQSEFSILSSKYENKSENMVKAPVNFQYSGRCLKGYSAWPTQAEQFGWYWFQDSSPNNLNYNVTIYATGSVDTKYNYDDSGHGYSIRCLSV